MVDMNETQSFRPCTSDCRNPNPNWAPSDKISPRHRLVSAFFFSINRYIEPLTIPSSAGCASGPRRRAEVKLKADRILGGDPACL
jgi:hypothetical protein